MSRQSSPMIERLRGCVIAFLIVSRGSFYSL
jgi:hypothetical protein